MISAVKWKSKTPSAPSPAERSYKFSYDKLYRLTGAVYADRAGTGSWTSAGAYDEKNISYDHNGNILTLKRHAKISGAIAEIDNLNYTYTANQLNNITDGTTTAHTGNGFRNLAASATAYSYNSDGSLTGDTKKGLALEYNVLNKTAKITMSGHTGRYITYSYDASGVLLRKQAYDNNVLVKTTDYVEDFVYENNTLSHFGMAEGRVRNNSGTLKYEYMISDNMGNVRVSFEEVAGVATVRQENSYYPFGLIMPGGYAASQPNRNLYNGGSEWQDDFGNLPDYYQTYYRNYDAALGRFISVDPLAEASESMTSYHYALNNPVMFNDPMGDLARVAVEMSQRLGAVMHGGYGRIGSGSGNHWADGIHYSDWNAWDGSASYRDGIEAGLMDHGGYLYDRASGGYGQRGDNASFWGNILSYTNSEYGGVWNGGRNGTWNPYTSDPGKSTTTYGHYGEIAYENGLPIVNIVGYQIYSASNSEQNKIFPSFSTLWKNYPHDINGEHQHPSSDNYRNQCAIRVGVALIKSGVSLKSYPKVNKTSEGYPRSSKNLADWLWQTYGRPSIISQKTFESDYWDKKGIMYIAPPVGGIGHIDLFNKGETGSGYYLGSEIWFWNIK